MMSVTLHSITETSTTMMNIIIFDNCNTCTPPPHMIIGVTFICKHIIITTLIMVIVKSFTLCAFKALWSCALSSPLTMGWGGRTDVTFCVLKKLSRLGISTGSVALAGPRIREKGVNSIVPPAFLAKLFEKIAYT